MPKTGRASYRRSVDWKADLTYHNTTGQMSNRRLRKEARRAMRRAAAPPSS